eukprot:TRINITY_DN8587_c0_g3_i1.p1 TRINITY_DN8587_c0_g3~~TRINITY_DN8587_c0_g3_i1.p1  ORF type:complete len:230 (+),score=31.16 TRINITY_DN8587_c0_g3_i1:308-997(+)
MGLQIGFLIFPYVQQLDLTGPYDVFAAMPFATVRLIWQDLEPFCSSSGMLLTPDTSFEDCPQLDVLCIPGGMGVNDVMEDEVTLDFIRQQAPGARYVTSVCTGSLVLAAAGLLRGRKATTHWASVQFLAALGAEVVNARVVRDDKYLTGGGVTAGIDFALTLAAELVGDTEAQVIQLQLEYAPAPPFDAGSPETAPRNVLALAQEKGVQSREARAAITSRVAARLGLTG